MARGVLNVVLEHLLRPFRMRDGAALTDGQLLERFVRDREDAVFATLVGRHAAMVMAVARRVLGDAHEAEDVFQATFFVLARKAGSIYRRPALSGWLYQIAYHLALKVRAKNVRRRAVECRVPPMPLAAPDTSLDSAEVRAVLDLELSRLPEKYRTPLILHYLEGKTMAETAIQLGWTPGTVSGRLAQARELLRNRLVRRGLALSSAAVTTLLADNVATATVATALVSATVNGALAFAQGLTSASAVSASAASLAKGMVQSMLVVKIKTVAAMMLVATVVAAGASAIGYRMLAGATNADALTRNPEAIRKSTAPLVPEQGVARAAMAQPVAQDKEGDAPIILAASGKVVDEKGQPLAGAEVYLREMASMREAAKLQRQGYTDILARTTTDANGRFAFNKVATESMGLSPSNAYRYPWNVVVTASRRGVAWRVFKAQREEDLTIVMRPEERLQGRLVDSNGKPAAGVRVRLNTIEEQLDPDPRKRVFSRDRLDLYLSQLPLAAVTDAGGEFLLTGLPKNLHIGLVASDARFARKYLSCATVDKAEIDRLNAPPSVPAESKLLADGFTATLEPSRSIRGLVTYGDTKAPAAGARVSIGIFVTLTDSGGRYSFQELASRKHHVHVKPPEGADYLTAASDVSITADTLAREHDFSLEPGSVITGELRDKETAEPIRLPYVGIDFQSEGGTPTYSTTRTKPDGSFRIVVPPGKGKLFTYDAVPGGVPRVPGSLERASIAISIKAGETLTGKNLLFLRGEGVHGRVLDAEGTPVGGAVFQGATEQLPSAADGAFMLRGLSRDQKSYFLVLDAGRGLGAKITVDPGKNANPMDVRLKPTQAVSARVVDEQKHPVVNAQVSLRVNIKTSERDNSFTIQPVNVYGPVRTDGAGTYKLPHLVADGGYTVLAAAPGLAPAQTSFRVEAGKDPILPDLVLLTNRLTIGGMVVDPGGTPLKGIQVRIMPRNQTLVNNHDSMNTEEDGRFHFHGLTKGEYRLLADLWTKTDALDKDGQPVSKREAGTELRVQSGEENIRIILHVPQDPERAARLVGKPAPNFPVARWLNRAAGMPEPFKVADNADRVLLLAFVDEAKPSQRLVTTLNTLHDKYGGKGLVIVRVYEMPVAEPALAKDSPTPAALVKPGLVAGRNSEAALNYGIRATPALFLIDRKGILRHADAEADGLEKRIEELLTR